MTLKLIQSHRKLLCRCSHCGKDSHTSVRTLRSFRFQWKHQSSGETYGICVVEDILHEGWKWIMEKLLQNQLYNELYKKHVFHKCIQLISSKHCRHIQPHASLWLCQCVPIFFAKRCISDSFFFLFKRHKCHVLEMILSQLESLYHNTTVSRFKIWRGTPPRWTLQFNPISPLAPAT